MAANQVGKCVTYNTLISTPSGDIPVGELFEKGEAFTVHSYDGEKVVEAFAEAPFKKEGLHECYRITLSDGQSVEVADFHRILTSTGYVHVQDLVTRVDNPLLTSLECVQKARALDDQRYKQRSPSYLSDYLWGFRHDDEQPLSFEGIDQVLPPSQGDAQQHTFASCGLDGLENIHTNNYRSLPYRLSNLGAYLLRLHHPYRHH